MLVQSDQFVQSVEKLVAPSSILRNILKAVEKMFLMIKMKRAKKCAITGEEATVTEAATASLVMWVSKTILVLNLIPQQMLHAVTVLPVVTWQKENVNSNITRKTSTRENKSLPEGGRKGELSPKGSNVNSKETVTESLTVPSFTVWRIFHNTTKPRGSKKPKETVKPNSDHKNRHHKY